MSGYYCKLHMYAVQKTLVDILRNKIEDRVLYVQ